jgi:hypothetical protein
LVLGGLSVVVVLDERRWGVEERQGEVERGGEREPVGGSYGEKIGEVEERRRVMEPVGGSYKGCRAVFIVVVVVVVVVRMLSDIVVVDGRREEVERRAGGLYSGVWGLGLWVQTRYRSPFTAAFRRLSPPFAAFRSFRSFQKIPVNVFWTCGSNSTSLLPQKGLKS